MSRLVASILLLLPILAAASPQLVFEPAHLDFGTLAQQQTRDATVRLRNTGSSPIHIERVETTCGCTVPELNVKVLGPGESAAMEVQFNSQHFQGKQVKYLKIYTDNDQQRIVDYQILANIEVPLLMTPPRTLITLGTIRTGTTAEATYTFTANDVPTLEIEPSVWPQDWLDIDVRPSGDPHTVDVVFSARQDASLGVHRESLKLRTNVPSVPVVNLEVDVRVVGDLMLAMDRVNLRRVRAGQAMNARVAVSPADDSVKFELTRAEIDIPGLTARVENGPRQSFAVIEGEAMAMDHPFAKESRGRIKGTLRIHTDLVSSPLFELPVTFILRR